MRFPRSYLLWALEGEENFERAIPILSRDDLALAHKTWPGGKVVLCIPDIEDNPGQVSLFKTNECSWTSVIGSFDALRLWVQQSNQFGFTRGDCWHLGLAIKRMCPDRQLVGWFDKRERIQHVEILLGRSAGEGPYLDIRGPHSG